VTNERVADDPLFYVFSISPGGEWVIAIATFEGNGNHPLGGQLVAISTRGLPTRVVCSFCSNGGGPARVYAPSMSWTRDGRLLLVSGQYIGHGGQRPAQDDCHPRSARAAVARSPRGRSQYC
jgi:hypothetical protein